MDPTVHMMTDSRRSTSNHLNESDNEDFYANESIRTGKNSKNTIIVKRGVGDKEQLKKKIVRQTNLIHSLEKNNTRNDSEYDKLKRRIVEQDEIIS